jgi:hypothetical protein
MNNKSKFFIIIISILLGIIMLQQCSRAKNDKVITKVDGKKYELIKQKTDTVIVYQNKIKYIKGDDIYHEYITEKYIKGKDIYYESIAENYINVLSYSKLDTINMIKNYNKKILYKDTLILDNNLGTIEVSDTISQNKIIGRKWNAHIMESTITNTKILRELPRNQIYIGVNSTINNSLLIFGPQILLKTKKDNIYGLNVSLDNNLNKYIGLNLNWKIKIKKI